MSAVIPSKSYALQIAKESARAAADSHVEVNLAPPEVLLVDDDELARERLRLIVESAGYTVTIARDGFEALRCLQNRFIPLLLTDIVMPVMGGLQLCRTVRSMALPSYLYTIVLSIRDNAQEVVAGLDAGADDYISKRATKTEMLARLLVGRRIVGLDQALRQAILKNQQLADMDPLTGTSNRRCLVGALEQEIARSRQHGHWVSVLMCDLDDFRQFNDHWGHVIGDEALQEFVARVRGLLGETAAWIGRYGGDEFVIVLPETPIERACRQAELIKHALTTNPLVYSAGALPLTVSIGVTGVGPTELRRAVSAAELLQMADECMCESSASGGDSITARAFRRADRTRHSRASLN